MKANVGFLDQGVRLAIGIGLLTAVIMMDSPLRWIGLVGIVPLFTGLFSYCPLYSLFGIKT